MTLDDALRTLEGEGDAARVRDLESRFGTRRFWGVAPDRLESLAREWRRSVPFPERLELARHLWTSGVFEGRLMAAKLLTQARIAEDGEVWTQICDWLSEASSWAELDALAAAGARRVGAELSRMEQVHALAASGRALDRRAAILLAAPLAKAEHPSEAETAAREAVTGWLPDLLDDPDKDVARPAERWLRTLAKHDPASAKAIRRAREAAAQNPESDEA
ncbi:DNA alkylation repair protein [Celeribacter indicus]|uniref:DNA alkylation repair enzyme n=1 Tax=Celeribacter indicus TaxID=1208324 RepID=A0A0B5DYW7_9RHOB|nr:DNA alkylation repair protein [Celeribacter indicus]AJE48169.1 hypothetical protein P73_3454 [Celeribacter indicus]SDW34307.1 DNA alkylation repair enzyme [Celeribacter indicus]